MAGHCVCVCVCMVQVLFSIDSFTCQQSADVIKMLQWRNKTLAVHEFFIFFIPFFVDTIRFEFQGDLLLCVALCLN